MYSYTDEKTPSLQDVWDGLQNILEGFEIFGKKLDKLLLCAEKVEEIGAPKTKEENKDIEDIEDKGKIIDELTNEAPMSENGKIWKSEFDYLELYPSSQYMDLMMELGGEAALERRLIIKDMLMSIPVEGQRDYLRDFLSKKVWREVFKNSIKKLIRELTQRLAKEMSVLLLDRHRLTMNADN